MSKAKKIILNGKNVIGIVWESEGKDLIVFDNDKAINFNHGISIRDIDTDKEDYIDLLDLISKKITYPEKEQPKGIEVKNSDGSTFAVLKQGEIVTTGKLNKGITLNINVNEKKSVEDLVKIISNELNDKLDIIRAYKNK